MPMHPFVSGSFGFHNGAAPDVLDAVKQLSAFLREDGMAQGTMEGHTATGVRGASLRAVHRDFADTMDQEPGSFVQLGDEDGMILDIRMSGNTAPRIELDDPIGGIRRFSDVLTRMLAGGIHDGMDPDTKRIYDAAARLIHADLVDAGVEMRLMDHLGIQYASPLAPLRVEGMTSGTVGTICDLTRHVSPENPASAMPTVIRITGGSPKRDHVHAILKPDPCYTDNDLLSPPDAIERLRLTDIVRKALA